jgi:putative PIN family toxin of toxin-antitoxin system
VLTRLRSLGELVVPAESVSVCRDPDDNRILEAAVAGRADYIVTGDADLLSMQSFQQIPIVTVSDFLELAGR